MSDITIYGASDDLVEVEGDPAVTINAPEGTTIKAVDHD